MLTTRRVHGVQCVMVFQQLTVDVGSRFPAVLTRKYGCDMAVEVLVYSATCVTNVGK